MRYGQYYGYRAISRMDIGFWIHVRWATRERFDRGEVAPLLKDLMTFKRVYGPYTIVVKKETTNNQYTLGLQIAQSRSYDLHTLDPNVGIIYVLGALGIAHLSPWFLEPETSNKARQSGQVAS